MIDSTPAKSESCAGCRFSVPTPGQTDVLSCCRYPPTPSVHVTRRMTLAGQAEEGLRIDGHFPPVPDDGWCGEFQAT